MKIRSRPTPPRFVAWGVALASLLAWPAYAEDSLRTDDTTASDAVTEPARSATQDRFLYGFQSTFIGQRKPTMHAAYSGDRSLLPQAENGYTLSATLFLGARPWQGTEVFVNPEMISAMNISDLHGLGGPSNGENQKGGTKTPSFYLARAFVRQTLSFGDDTLQVDSGQNQFATRVGSRRLVLTVGNMSIIDVFDVNPNAHDSRTQFMNWALLTHGAFDFAADLRGYTWGAAVEYYHDAWAFRFGRFAVPKESNGMAIDFHLFSHYGDSLEVEHSYTALGKTGRVSVLGFRNYERMFAFRDATAVVEANGGYSDKIVDDVRRNQPKYGFGISLEQSLHRDVGVFLRGSWNDGKTETYSFSEIERSLALGASVRGALWHRASDASGVVWVMNGISQAHQDYLANGGLGFFIGDGRISYKPEELLEVYYSAQVMRGLWFALDYQLIVHPAYNADRGPAQFLGVRLHLEI